MSLTVETKFGKVNGITTDGIRQWFGIPYAKAPIGDLRFRRAQECEPWDDVKDCTQKKSSCIQFKLSFYCKPTDSEDCLYINIWRPDTEETNLPVFVWIHGGYLHFGSGNEDYYDGRNMAKQGVIYVSFNYRLGPLGCYDFSQYNKDLFDSNCTLSDQILALKWVHENIGAFGGDVSNVTINGESAGGLSVLTLMVCPSVKGYFQKVICQSGYPDGIHSKRSSKLLMDMFLEYLKISPEEVGKIRDLDVKTLQKACDYVCTHCHKHAGIFFPGFVYDDLLPENCYEAIKKGETNGIKLIIGTCRNECNLFRLYHESPANWKEIEQMCENNNMMEKLPELKKFYGRFKGEREQSLRLGTDHLFFIGSSHYADLQSKNNDVWMYRFDYAPLLAKMVGLSATHFIDVFIALNTMKSGFGRLIWFGNRPSSKEILIRSMNGAWIQFAKTGNPNGDHLTTTWEKYDANTRKTLLFDRNVTLVENPSKENIELWENYHQLYQ